MIFSDVLIRLMKVKKKKSALYTIQSILIVAPKRLCRLLATHSLVLKRHQNIVRDRLFSD